MICKRCGVRAETRDCSSVELRYSLCDFCIKELKENGEFDLWDSHFKFGVKKIDGDYHELYQDRDFIARVHKDDIRKVVDLLNALYDDCKDNRMAYFDIKRDLNILLDMVEEKISKYEKGIL